MRFQITTALLATFLSASLARQIQAQAVVHVAQFGAFSNDQKDDILAIRAAIAALQTTESVLRFDPGTYDVNPMTVLVAPAAATAPRKGIFPISGMSSLTINYNQVLPGSTILYGDRTWPMIFGSYTKVDNVGF